MLVCLQVAFCVVLLHASFLAVRGLQRAATASIGWNPNGLVMAATELGLARYNAEQSDAYRAACGRSGARASRHCVGRRPRIRCRCTSINRRRHCLRIRRRSRSADCRRRSTTSRRASSPPCRSPCATAATSTNSIRAMSPPVAIVNRAIADRLFEGNAIGQQLRSGRGGTPMQIVGVVEDGKYTDARGGARAGRFSARCRRPSPPRRC